MRDSDLLYYHRQYRVTAETLAAQFNLSVASVRGRLSRAAADPATNLQVMRRLMENPEAETASYQEIQRKTRAAQNRLDALLNEREQDRIVILWTGDVHLPNTRHDAAELTVQIAAAYKPDIVITMNDLFDNGMFGAHTNYDKPKQKQWSKDFYRVNQTAASWHAALRSASGGQLVGLMGNHDVWALRFLMERDDPLNDIDALVWYNMLESQGVLLPSFDPREENVIKVSPGLKLVHGVSASANNLSLAASTLNKLSGTDDTGDSGIFYNTAAGHVHRDFEVEMYGVTHWNFGCLSKNPSYMKHTPHWNLGVGIIYAGRNTRKVTAERIRFTRNGSELRADTTLGSFSAKLAEDR